MFRGGGGELKPRVHYDDKKGDGSLKEEPIIVLSTQKNSEPIVVLSRQKNIEQAKKQLTLGTCEPHRLQHSIDYKSKPYA